METIEATFQIVTPMFLEGANQDADDGIRPPSVKGALRFWWRALNWGRFRSAVTSDEIALKQLHTEECRLFGTAADERGRGQGSFLLQVKHAPFSPSKPDIPNFSGKAYLACMGLGDRLTLPVSTDFTIELCFRPRTDNSTKENFHEIFRFLGIIGGLGSRNRRGFGSIVGLIKEDNSWRLPTEEEFENSCDWLKTKISSSGTARSPFSALSTGSLFFRSNSDYSSWDAAMEKVGKIMNRYRTSGTERVQNRIAAAGTRFITDDNNRPVSVPEADLNFYITDHHQVHTIASTKSINRMTGIAPLRSIFGLPHPYRFTSGKKVTFDFVPPWSPGTTSKGRRASPLFLHIATFVNAHNQQKFRPLLLLLPADFLPTHAQLEVSMGRGPSVGSVPAPTNYVPIQTFLSTHFTSC